ncbi:MAG: ribosome biogenesis GTPase YlqF [Bacilli bacterium]|nr:ribosome biogenesis GTPase YlqF [Bacilli bacterium]MDD4282438.1 ribosome biogenesis GTPase YlqF [Bacilli bacterium]MDD4718909.1 ribosome biogenesis GTPase YlqF [Bacilli bacterium]
MEHKTNINWYPGHMAKTRRQMSEHMKLVDLVYEVVDARMPASSRIKDIDAIIGSKPRVIILTKMDLCEISETNKWIKHYEKQGHKVIGLDLSKNINLKTLISLTEDVIKPINEKRSKQGLIKRKTRVMIIGIPNVGKSTLINRLVGKKAAKIGNKPGVTKSLDWIRINNDLELLDTPGILWPKLDDKTIAFNLASLTAIKEEVLPLDEVAVYILKVLSKHYPKTLEERYGVTDIDFEDILPTLDIIGIKRGCLVKGGEIDYDKVVNIIINDLKNGIIKNVTFDRYDSNEA